MKKRYILFAVIGLMCFTVTVLGDMIFVKGDSVLKQLDGVSSNVLPSKPPDDLKILVDITENKMFLISEGKVLKTYLIASGKYGTPSPIGDWIIVSKDTWGDGFGGHWMGFNVPWAKLFMEYKNKYITAYHIELIKICYSIRINKMKKLNY